MVRILIVLAVASSFAFAPACASEPAPAPAAAAPELVNDDQKTLYALGVLIGQRVSSFKLNAAEGTLPLPTRIVIWLSNFLSGWGGLSLALSAVGLFVGIQQWRKTETGLRTTDRIAMNIPVVGMLIRKVAVAKFTRTMGTLLTSGVPILEGLIIVAKTAGNKVIEEAIFMTRQSVSEGKTLAEPLSKSKVFPAMVNQMIAVGEATGALDNMLNKIADFYDEEVDTAVSALTSMLEPLLMIFLGTTVGFVIVAMYMPIFQMGALAGK